MKLFIICLSVFAVGALCNVDEPCIVTPDRKGSSKPLRGTYQPREKCLNAGRAAFSKSEPITTQNFSDDKENANEKDGSLQCCVEISCGDRGKCRNNVEGNPCTEGSYLPNLNRARHLCPASASDDNVQCCSEKIDQNTHTGLKIRREILPRFTCYDLNSPDPDCLFQKFSRSGFMDYVGAGDSVADTSPGGGTQVPADASPGTGTGGSGEISTQASDLSGPYHVGTSNPPAAPPPPATPPPPSTGDTTTALLNPSDPGQGSAITTITPSGNTAFSFDPSKSPFSSGPTIGDTTSPAPVPPSTPDIAPNTPAVQAVTPPAPVPDSSPNQPIIPNAITATTPAPVSLPNTAFNPETVPNIRLNSANNNALDSPAVSSFDRLSNAIVTLPDAQVAPSTPEGPVLGIKPSNGLLTVGYQGARDGVTISPVYPAANLLGGPGDFSDKLFAGGRVDWTHRFGPHKA